MASKKPTKSKNTSRTPKKSYASSQKSTGSTKSKSKSKKEPIIIADAYPTHLKIQSITNTYIILAIIIRILSALLNPISDCDETYNYWEPTSFLINNYGFENWEYAPTYALRSYLYLIPQFIIGKLLLFIPFIQQNPSFIFYIIRVILSLTCFCCELYFCKSLTSWFGRRTSFFTFIFMVFSSGMFNCCSAYLPQQFVVCFILLSFGALFKEKKIKAIFFMGIAAIIGWPFIALLAVPMAIDCILSLGSFMFSVYVAIFGGLLCGACIAVDYVYYGKIVLAPLNIFIYNLAVTNSGDGSQGQNLYGVDDWTYYFKNLAFNWNVVFVSCLIAPIATNLFILLVWNKKKRAQNRGRRARGVSVMRKLMNLLSFGDNSAIVIRLLHCITPFWIWYLFFSYMPHKEERFMFVIYPFIALNAALTLTQFRLIKVDEDGNWSILGYNIIGRKVISFIVTNLLFGVVTIFIVLCSARSVGQVK